MKVEDMPVFHGYTVTSKAWWLDGKLENPYTKKIEVARVSAKHKTKRYPAKHELEYRDELPINKYFASEHYTGEAPTYMLGISLEEVELLVQCEDYASLREVGYFLKEVSSNPQPKSHNLIPASFNTYIKAMETLEEWETLD